MFSLIARRACGLLRRCAGASRPISAIPACGTCDEKHPMLGRLFRHKA